MFVLEIILSFVFGAAIGSFLNVVILRLPEEETLGGRSHCPSCKHELGALDLVPMFSYLLLGGRCRYCKTKVSARYFVIELITACLFALSFWFINPGNLFSYFELVKFWLGSAVLLVVFVIDFEHYLILDEVIFPSAIFLALVNLALDFSGHSAIVSWQGMFASGLIGAAVFSGVFYLLWYFSKGKYLGFGDVKLAIFLGLLLGPASSLAGFMISVGLGAIVSLFLLLFTKKTLKSQLPFGTFLAIGSLIVLFYGPWLINWYLRFLGV